MLSEKTKRLLQDVFHNNEEKYALAVEYCEERGFAPYDSVEAGSLFIFPGETDVEKAIKDLMSGIILDGEILEEYEDEDEKEKFRMYARENAYKYKGGIVIRY